MNRASPGQVGTATDWQSVAAGEYHTIGRRQNGTLWTWGNNSYAQLGYPNFFDAPRQITWRVLATAAAKPAATLALFPTLIEAGQSLHYAVPDPGAELAVYSLTGRQLATYQLAVAGHIRAGMLPAGWYLVRLRYPDGRTATSRFLVH